MRRIALSILAVLALAAALASGQGKAKPRDWSWLSPGRTTRADVLARVGEPDVVYQRRLKKGVLELDPRSTSSGPFGRRQRVIAAADKLPVEILQYSANEGEERDNLLVFHDGRLVYALVRPPESELAVSDIERRRGEPQISRMVVGDGCLLRGHLVLRYDAARVAYVGDERSSGCTECKQMLIWCGPTEFGAPLEGVAWSLPKSAFPPRKSAGGK